MPAHRSTKSTKPSKAIARSRNRKQNMPNPSSKIAACSLVNRDSYKHIKCPGDGSIEPGVHQQREIHELLHMPTPPPKLISVTLMVSARTLIAKSRISALSQPSGGRTVWVMRLD